MRRPSVGGEALPSALNSVSEAVVCRGSCCLAGGPQLPPLPYCSLGWDKTAGRKSDSVIQQTFTGILVCVINCLRHWNLISE